MWIVFACGSALFAGLTAVLAKAGIREIDSTLATALRRGPDAPTQWVVDVPGGRVNVGLDGVIDWSGNAPRITDASVFLTGPATRVAEIRLS